MRVILVVLLLFPDYFILELFIILITLYFVTSSNVMVLLYNAGLYLILLGLYSLLNDADIFIGFLWVIDLGVGLIFFIFMLHFVPFLHQKSSFNLKSKHIILYTLVFVNLVIYFY